MTTATPKRTKKPIPVRIENVGGIRAAALELLPGCINVLVGENGSGKSTSLDCILRAAGAKRPLEVRDGAHMGSVDLPGIRLQIRSSVRSTGHAEVHLADTGPLTRLIDPGYKGSDEAASARVRALLEMIRPEFDAGVVATLADGDPSIADAVEQELREGALTSLVDVAERVRLTAHGQARAAEALAQQAAGKSTSAELTAAAALEKAGGDEALTDMPVAEAEQIETQAREALGAARAARDKRLALERQQQEIRATLGHPPDPDRFEQDVTLRRDAVAASERRLEAFQTELRELERKISQEREALAGVRQDLRSLEELQRSERERLRTHQQQLAILDQVPEGPTDEQLERYEQLAAAAQEQRRAAVVSAEVKSLAAAAEAAKEELAVAAEHAARLRDIARTVFDRLAMLPGVAERAYPLTIVAGRVAVIDGEHLHDFETRRSEGQRIDAAFAVAAKAYALPDGESRAPIVALDARYWTALDPEHQRTAATAAAQYGLTVVTEQPTEGELAVLHLAGATTAAEPMAAGAGA